MEEKNKFVSGFVSIIGRPNAGKSTLLNALVGARLAIVADKPQTTRNIIQGVWNSDDAQIVFLDTPGIHRSGTLFDKRMMGEIRGALEARDLLLWVADASRRITSEDEQGLDMLRKAETPTFLVLNKVDRVSDKRYLLPTIEAWQKRFDFADYVPVSALTGDGVERLRNLILARLPEGQRWFPPDQVTDQPERFLAAEFIREKILEVTHQEVPHSVAVFIESWEESPRLTKISATIWVEREGQKGIVIGARGATLKEIGTAARQDIEELLGTKVFLELFVKVRENWRENPLFLRELDWRTGTQPGISMAERKESEDEGPVILPEP